MTLEYEITKGRTKYVTTDISHALLMSFNGYKVVSRMYVGAVKEKDECTSPTTTTKTDTQ